MAAQVLVADSDPALLAGLCALLRSSGYSVKQAVGAAAALRALDEEKFEVVVLDSQLSHSSGHDLLAEVVALADSPSVVLLTSDADVSTAVAAMRLGAENVLEKPVHDDALEEAVQSALRNRVAINRVHGANSGGTRHTSSLIGASIGLRRVLDQIERVASAPKVTTLILGESGVGKELVARAIHSLSDRCSGPFIALNCAALTDGLLEAELFGYEPGSFTGAAPRGHDGLFAAADGGTLFLDEIGELALPLQAKLLRVLQDGTYRRVGSSEDKPSNVRILSSTNRDLDRCVADGSFREDLFYRLNVLSIRVPPLRDRKDDIPLLAVEFLEEFGLKMNRELKGFSEAAMQRLVAHPWPGNVRELRNTIERGVLMVESGRIQSEHLGLTSQFTVSPDSAEEDLSLQAVEKAHISRVIRETAGNRSRAARLLGVNRTTLYNKLRRYGISPVAS